MKDKKKLDLKKYDKFLIILGVCLVMVVLSWFISAGVYYDGVFSDYGMVRAGIYDFVYLLYGSFSYAVAEIFYIWMIGAAYVILSKTSFYKKALDGFVNLIKGHEKLALALIVAITGIYTSISSYFLVLFVFIPFIVSAFLKCGKNRLTAISAATGGMFVGLIGTTFGTFGQYYWTYYTSVEVTSYIWIKVLIFVIAYALYVLFALLYMNKHRKRVDEVKYDKFLIENTLDEEVKKHKTKNIWPIVLADVAVVFGIFVFALLISKLCFKSLSFAAIAVTSIILLFIVFIILTIIVRCAHCSSKSIWSKMYKFVTYFILIFLVFISLITYINWSDSFGIEFFTDLNTKITTDLTIGDVTILGDILGSNMGAIGTATNGSAITFYLILFMCVYGLYHRIALSDFLKDGLVGIKRVLNVSIIYALCFAPFLFTSYYPWLFTIANSLIGDNGFNLMILMVVALLFQFFMADQTYVGYFFAQYFTLTFADSLALSSLVWRVTSGLLCVIGPTSFVLMAALTYLDIPYTKWLKYIWKFALSMLLVICIIFMIVAYM